MLVREFALGLMLVGCASELASSARLDDLGTFKRKLETAARSAEPEELDLATLREVAQSVASRELVTSRGSTAVSRVLEVSTCTPSLEDALASVAESHGEAGALAHQLLIDAGHRDDELERLCDQFASDERPAWRAVGLRAAVASGQVQLRAKGILDPDLRVRRAALRAALDARSAADLPALTEAARLDPDRVCRGFALEAIGQIGDELAIARLRELWAQADERERMDIVRIWARAYAQGGHQQLGWVLSTQTGLARLAAASAVADKAVPEGAWGDDLLVAAIVSGPREEMRYVAEHAPKTARVKAALEEALQAKDESKAGWAAVALLRSNPKHERALVRLRALKLSAEQTIADMARFNLAALGEPDALSWVLAQAKAKEGERRLMAGLVIWADGSRTMAPALVAPLLADSDASVRTRFACRVLGGNAPEVDYFQSQVRP